MLFCTLLQITRRCNALPAVPWGQWDHKDLSRLLSVLPALVQISPALFCPAGEV